MVSCRRAGGPVAQDVCTGVSFSPFVSKMNDDEMSMQEQIYRHPFYITFSGVEVDAIDTFTKFRYMVSCIDIELVRSGDMNSTHQCIQHCFIDT